MKKPNAPTRRIRAASLSFMSALVAIVLSGAPFQSSAEQSDLNSKIKATEASRNNADRILRNSYAAMASLPWPEKCNQAIALLRQAMTQDSFGELQSVKQFFEAVERVNTYLIAKSDRSSVNKWDSSERNTNLIRLQASVSATPVVVSSRGSTEWENDTQSQNSKMESFAIKTKPDFTTAEFNELREDASKKYSLMVRDLKRLGFSILLDDLLCSHKWSWRFTGDPGKATIIFDCRVDGRFEARFFPDSRLEWLSSGGGLIDTGYGEWRLEGATLTMKMTHVSILGVKKKQDVEWIASEITFAAEDKILLNNKTDNRLIKVIDS